MVQAGLLLHFLARSRRIRIFRSTLAPEPLEDIDHRPLHNLEGPLTMRHESSQKRYTMALAGTAGLALSLEVLAQPQGVRPQHTSRTRADSIHIGTEMPTRVSIDCLDLGGSGSVP